MPGSLVALVAKSDEDKHLTGNPQITFWKSAHKRHSNFCLQRYLISRPTERIRSATVEFKIESIGDLLRGLTLEIDLPSLADISGAIYTDMVGCAAIEKAEFIIGGQVIQTLWGDWIAAYELLVENFGKQYALDQLRGGDILTSLDPVDSDGCVYEGSSVAQVVRIPLPYWFSRTSGAALPLVGLRHTDVRVRVFLRPFDQLIFKEAPSTGATGLYYGAVQMYADVIHLDREERTSFVSEPLQYLIETVQRNHKVMTAVMNQTRSKSFEPIGVTNPFMVTESVPLHLNLPVKELVWMLEPEPFSIDASIFTAGCSVSYRNRWLSFPVNEYDLSCRAYVDLIQDVTLRVGGQSVFETEKADWFRLEQPIRYHTNVPAARLKGIYTHSFAIRPEEYQPSGTLNFSAVDKAELVVSMTKPNMQYSLVVFAWGYNILNIQNGIGGLAYSY